MFHLTRHDTPVGRLTLVASDAGLRAVLWPVERTGRVRLPADLVEAPHPVLDRTIAQLDEYVAGRRRTFELPLDLHGTPFQVKVWRALLDVGYGATTSYGALAAPLGGGNLSRAVGAAVGRNPVSIVVPCHRVVGADGSLTGFAGGLDAKRWLLALEAGGR